MTPLVTICLPVFNSSEYLQEAILSVLNQSYPRIQIIAIDDCSSDNSYEIIKSHESSNFIVHKNSNNLGMVENWNKCIALADGKYIKMMGADDVLMPDCLAKQVAILESQNVDMVSSNRFLISSTGKTILKLKYPLLGFIPPNLALRKLVSAGRNIIGEPVACLIRKDALERVGGFSAINRYVIDIATWAKLIKTNGLFAMDEYLCSFRISNTSISSKEGFNQIKSVFEFIGTFKISEVGLFSKAKGYFLAIFFGVIRNIVFKVFI